MISQLHRVMVGSRLLYLKACGHQGVGSWMQVFSPGTGSDRRDWDSNKFVRAGFASGSANYDKEMDEINDLFAQAREEIMDARDDAETVYFNESAEAAQGIVDQVLSKYQALLAKLDEDSKGKVQRFMGLKMEQLKAEAQGLKELHA